MNATVHLLCGKVGSGKTTFGRKLAIESAAVLLSVILDFGFWSRSERKFEPPASDEDFVEVEV